MRKLLLRFLTDQSGATSIEYALIATGIAMAVITAVFNLGTSVSAQYTTLSTALAQMHH